MTALAIHPAFDYSQIASLPERQWLEKTTANIQVLAKKTAVSLLQMGLFLKEVHDRLPLYFTEWVSTKTAISAPNAYKMIRAADCFQLDTPFLEQFDPTALMVLSHWSVKENVRSMALDMAKDGTRITTGKSREILTLLRNAKSTVTKEYVKDYFNNRKEVDKSFPNERPKPAVTSTDYASVALDGLVAMVNNAARVQIERMTDTETPDDPNASPWMLTVWPNDSHRPKTFQSSDSLMALLLGASGLQPSRTCANPACGQTKPLFDGFSRKEGNTDGRASSCRKCEVTRVTAAKHRTKKVGRTQPTVATVVVPEGLLAGLVVSGRYLKGPRSPEANPSPSSTMLSADRRTQNWSVEDRPVGNLDEQPQTLDS